MIPLMFASLTLGAAPDGTTPTKPPASMPSPSSPGFHKWVLKDMQASIAFSEEMVEWRAEFEERFLCDNPECDTPKRRSDHREWLAENRAYILKMKRVERELLSLHAEWDRNPKVVTREQIDRLDKLMKLLDEPYRPTAPMPREIKPRDAVTKP